MKVLVRDATAGCYFCQFGVWTPERRRALNLEQIHRASALIDAEGWERVEIILAYDEPLCDLVLPHDPLEYR